MRFPLEPQHVASTPRAQQACRRDQAASFCRDARLRSCGSRWRLRRRIDLGVTSTSSSSRSEEHTSELQSLMRTSYVVFCLQNKNKLFHMKNNRTHTKLT